MSGRSVLVMNGATISVQTVSAHDRSHKTVWPASVVLRQKRGDFWCFLWWEIFSWNHLKRLQISANISLPISAYHGQSTPSSSIPCFSRHCICEEHTEKQGFCSSSWSATLDSRWCRPYTLDASLVAKAAIASPLVQGTVSTLAPEKAIAQYGSDPTPASTVFMRRIGVSGLHVAAMAFGMISKGWDVNTAAGTEAIIWSTEILKGLLNDESSAVGYDKTSMVVWLALPAACGYTFFSRVQVAQTPSSSSFQSLWLLLALRLLYFQPRDSRHMDSTPARLPS